jgi:hypothetical protein
MSSKVKKTKLDSWVKTNMNVLTGYIKGKKVWTDPIVARKGDEVYDKNGVAYSLGEHYIPEVRPNDPKERVQKNRTEAIIAHHMFLAGLKDLTPPEEGQVEENHIN